MRIRLTMLAFLAVLMVVLIPLHGQRCRLDGPGRGYGPHTHAKDAKPRSLAGSAASQ